MMKRERSKFGELFGKVFCDGNGRIRTGWLLALTLLLFYGIRLSVRLGINSVFAAIFSAWGVDMSSVYRAPKWAQIVYIWHGSAVTVIVSLCMLAVALMLRRIWMKSHISLGKASKGGVLMLVGISYTLISAMLFLILDSMRLEWPLDQPVFSFSQVVLLLVTAVSAVSEEVFYKQILLDGIKSRWGLIAGILISMLIFFVDGAGYTGNAFCGINVFLMGVLCCCLYLKYGLLASAGFRCGCGFAGSMLVGFGNAKADSIYRIYHVSDAWLTGGEGGPVYGLWQTIVLLVGLLWLNRETIKSVLPRLHKN